jgi:hypothetical protein
MKQEKKVPTSKPTDAEKVEEWMINLEHPFKNEIDAVRTIIKGASNKVAERIKWNAPSYYYQEEMVTFNHRATQHVHLVFHHPAIVNIQSDLLEGDYKDRRMMYLRNMKEVKAHKKELQNVIKQLVIFIDNQ